MNDEDDLVRFQEQLAGVEGMAKAEARFGKPLSQLTEAELATGTREANAKIRRRGTSSYAPPEYYAYAAEGNRRCQERRRSQKK